MADETQADSRATASPPPPAALRLTSPSRVRALLATMDFRPSKLLGQNFLIDENIRRIILDAAALTRADGVVEVGPGLGVLTEGLLQRAGRVLAIEKDRRLHAHLAAAFAAAPGLALRHGDATDLDYAPLISDGFDIMVSNLPYSVGSRLLVDWFCCPRPPRRIVVTVQREVAERLAAPPGGKDYGLLSILAQCRHAVSLRKIVSPTCFLPPPQISSAVVLCERTAGDEPADLIPLRDLVKAAFSRRRKQMVGILAALGESEAVAVLAQTGIAPAARPEEVTVAQWQLLAAISPKSQAQGPKSED